MSEPYRRIQNMSLRDLSRELAKASRIDRDGQELLKRWSAIRAYVGRAKLSASRLESLPQVQRCLEIFAKESFQQQVKLVLSLPADQAPKGFFALLTQYDLSPTDLKQRKELLKQRKIVKTGGEYLAKVQGWIADHEFEGGLQGLPKISITPEGGDHALSEMVRIGEKPPPEKPKPPADEQERIRAMMQDLLSDE